MEPRVQETEFKIPKIGIYTGKGASHSWLWFVEIFERLGFYNLCFLTEFDLVSDSLEKVDVLAVSGGDTFAIAEALGPQGAKQLKTFITRGGLYLGSCAGAYLPLNSSKEHLNHFNFVPAKITNLTKTLPESHGMKEKLCTCYGCSFIFHAVREAVEVTTSGLPPFGESATFTAPLYGGPPMTVTNPASVMATYTAFTDKTLFLVDRELAEKTLLGNAAVIREKMGHGHLHLFGPHFEHPHFGEANLFLANAMMLDLPHQTVPSETPENGMAILAGSKKKGFIRDFKRELSNSRIVAAGLEMIPLKWTIGSKIYETGKIRVFLEALWQRIRSFETSGFILVRADEVDHLVQTALHVTKNIRQIKKGWDRKMDTLATATALFNLLNKTSALFLEIYFRSKLFHADSAKVRMLRRPGQFRKIEYERFHGQIKKMVA